MRISDWSSDVCSSDLFQSKIVIVNACTALSASLLDFGSQGVLSTDVDQSSAIKVTCTTAALYTVKLDAGANAGTPGDVSTRQMANGPNLVTYQLYSHAPGGLAWANTKHRRATG